MTTSQHPDAKKHLRISLAKSAIRILGAGGLIAGALPLAGICFLLAEVLGIAEELV